VQELERTGDATGYACATHGNFKVANSVFAEQRAKDYTREQWEAALDKAKQRTKSGEWPVINRYDFWAQWKCEAKMKLTILFVVVVGATVGASFRPHAGQRAFDWRHHVRGGDVFSLQRRAFGRSK
jgi:hypothetical protein